MQGRARQRSDLARDAQYRQAVRLVGSELEGQQMVVERQDAADIGAYRRVGREHQQS